MRIVAPLALVLAAVIGFGCQGSKSDSAVAENTKTDRNNAKPGWQNVTTKSTELQLPDTMKVIDITSADFDAALAKVFEANPNLRTMETQLKQARSSGMFEMFAFGEKSSSGFVENVNVVVESVPTAVTLDQYEQAMKSQLQQMAPAGASVTSERKTVGGKEFSVTTSSLNAPMERGTGPVASIGWVTLSAGKAFVVTFTTVPEWKDRLMGVAEEAMATFRVR